MIGEVTAMREGICTIPVSEGFEPKDGCPLCRMRAVAEKRVIDYIMGAAMMEPDVRVKTNELGFCREHFAKMRRANNRLSLALMLDSHLTEIKNGVFGEGRKLFKPSTKKIMYKAVRLSETCFVCDKMNFGAEHMLSTIYRTYESDKDFRRLYSEQSEFCLPHYSLIVGSIPENMNRDMAKQLELETKRITLAYLDELSGDVQHFCKMFDYRNNSEDADWGNSKDAIERSIAFLDGGLPDRIKIK